MSLHCGKHKVWLGFLILMDIAIRFMFHFIGILLRFVSRKLFNIGNNLLIYYKV